MPFHGMNLLIRLRSKIWNDFQPTPCLEVFECSTPLKNLIMVASVSTWEISFSISHGLQMTLRIFYVFGGYE